MVQPHAYNKTTRKTDINPDFVKLYPDKAGDFYQEVDMNKAGYTKLPEHAKKVKDRIARHKAKVQASVVFEGNTNKGIERVLK